jgi:uncharacterized protein YqhQ
MVAVPIFSPVALLVYVMVVGGSRRIGKLFDCADAAVTVVAKMIAAISILISILQKKNRSHDLHRRCGSPSQLRVTPR